jgi:hypothetical protein
METLARLGVNGRRRCREQPTGVKSPMHTRARPSTNQPQPKNQPTDSSKLIAEPTSGLDACSALGVIEHLRDRARESGLTVVASIHQPRAAVWTCFDACAVLSGGLGMYQGPCSAIVDWFQGTQGYGPWDSAVHGTASDWVMDLVNVGFSKGELHGYTIATRSDLEQSAGRFAQHFRRARAQAAEGKQLAEAKGVAALAAEPAKGAAAAAASEARRLSSSTAAAAHCSGDLGASLRPQQLQAAATLRRGPLSGGGGGGSSNRSSAAGAAPDDGGGYAVSTAVSVSGGGASPRHTLRRQQQQGVGGAHGGPVSLPAAVPAGPLSSTFTISRGPTGPRAVVKVEASPGSCSSLSSLALSEGADCDRMRPGWWTQFK